LELAHISGPCVIVQCRPPCVRHTTLPPVGTNSLTAR
jgi:hypothetical protein